MPDDTVMIVEDNDVLREGICDMLTQEGFNVLAASNGIEALKKMEITQPALIMSDIAMPEMDGLQLVNAIRARQEWVSIPFIFLTAKADRQDVMIGRNLGADDYLTKPISRDEMITTIRSRLSRARQIQMAQVQHAYLESLITLANAVDRREKDAKGHVERITDYCMALAKHLQWKERQIEVLRYGAILHDLGKIHIPETILLKTTPLNADEWALIRRHPVVGAEMVRDVPFPLLQEAVPYIRHHHEHWDGSGYPDGLQATDIPEGSLIIAVADSFDSMTIARPFKPARALDEAYYEILHLAGSKYAPNVTAAFQRAWLSGEIHSIANKHL